MNAHSTSESSEAYIALGANLGDREHTLLEAISRLDAHPDTQVLRCSDLYETEPVGYVDQPPFVNMAIAVRTTLSPLELLHYMLHIEQELGRVRSIRWGPRTIDLDLLFMEGVALQTPELELPHPRMEERAFVLLPLSDILIENDLSGLTDIVQSALRKLDGKDGIQRWKTCNWRSASAPSGS
ncbi:2-amino-4-hydroxy-6-hydroxymethyldihydropteridine diphosphokinase [Paenibacillus sp. P96]|uniref:2-amino-4-hydroxy-6-hydroxymethyldihydropteridine diphosphokinase n=1 Tax=Paenibacillus zeirhizosphaerae TaxID=2987519 RepID=A0ABT9FWV7_9BACL|nr:2-amino-4-hydroxy-6-hydroxymethyldihydropteridine diphosphokinase [Paenibacillus sp. P96]MDP4099208.1 2-amino-4-hydroxy-6-hydroxymethyldihydropteridine diphosphokinase [Paenibacillus sp. P96]